MATNGVNGASGNNEMWDPNQKLEYDIKKYDEVNSVFLQLSNTASRICTARDANGDQKTTKEDIPIIDSYIAKIRDFSNKVYQFTLTDAGKKALAKLSKKLGFNAEERYLQISKSCDSITDGQHSGLTNLKNKIKSGEWGCTEEQYQQADAWKVEAETALEQNKAYIESTDHEDLADIRASQSNLEALRNVIREEFNKGNDTYRGVLSPIISKLNDAIKTMQTHIDEINENLADLEPDDCDALEMAQRFVTAQIKAADPQGFSAALAQADKEGDGYLLYCEKNDPALVKAKDKLWSAINILSNKASEKGIGSRAREIYSNGRQYLQDLMDSYNQLCESEPGLPEGTTINNIYYNRNGEYNLDSIIFRNKQAMYNSILNYFADDQGDLTETSYKGFLQYINDHAIYSVNNKGERVYSNDISQLHDNRFLTKDDVEYLTRFFELPKSRRNVSSMIGRPSEEHTAKLDQQRRDKFKADYELAQQQFAERWSKAVAWYWSGDNRSHDAVADLTVIGYTKEQAEAIINKKS